ncbi:MAG: UvrD-helicase domain-containing protein [Oscillospiraceae bacterium]|nr:UvrD-helicase domain-containing protein [Oscillospiraceae bacterium]
MSEQKFDYTPEQKAVVAYRGGALLVSAAAGSGKTKVLVDRLISRIEEGANINDFLVITYTRAAALELRERIYDEIQKRLSYKPDNRRLRRQAMLCRGAKIGTIHSFCTDVLRENAHSVNLASDFRVADESECALLKAEILEDVLDKAYEQPQGDLSDAFAIDFEGFRALVDSVSPGRDDQRLAGIILSTHAKLQSNPNPKAWAMQQVQMLNLHGITEISETIWGAYLMEKAYEIADFWLGEMSKVSTQMKAFPDFHKAYGASIEATRVSIEAFLSALDKGWDEARRMSAIDFPGAKAVKGYEEFKDIRLRCKAAMKKLTMIFECSAQAHMEDMRAVAPTMATLIDLIFEFDRLYAMAKRRRNVVDFSDLEHLTCALLSHNETGKRTGLASSISHRFREILIDEFQDVNAVQELIFNAIAQDGKNIFMVGDVKQSIYRFRLADPSIFLDKYERFEDLAIGDVMDCVQDRSDEDRQTRHLEQETKAQEACISESMRASEAAPSDENKGRKILLSQNFRSHAGILEAVNFIFSAVMSRKFGEMDYTEREALVPGRVTDLHISEAEMGVASSDNPVLRDTPVELNVIDMSGLEQDEDEESPAKAQIEARYIAGRIAELTDGKHLIADKSGIMRPIEYSDIVILLRSITGKAWQYAAALSEQGIPVSLPGGEGFFETIEISAVLSLLSVIDNPMQDIALAAALSGPVYGFSADELAEIRAYSPRSDFYTALLYVSNRSHPISGAEVPESEMGTGMSAFHADDLCDNRPLSALSLKCAAFLAEIDAMRLIMPDLPADRFIWYLYNKTGLLEVVGALRGGEKRRNNLISFAESARTFEQNGYKGIFGFLVYVRGLRERGAELRHDDSGSLSAEALQDTVQIMSIHKSKGLEFPVVFLADTSKQLNNSDAQQSLVMHPEFGFGLMRMDEKRRIEYTTMARMAVQSKLKSEMMAEELRVLYVAMTRARERLIITAALRDAQKELDKYSKIGDWVERGERRVESGERKEESGEWSVGVVAKGAVAPQVLEDIRSMAGWILAAYTSCAQGREIIALSVIGAEALGQQPMDTSESNTVGESCVRPQESSAPLQISAHTNKKQFDYPYPNAPELPSKLTVTGLKGLHADTEAGVLYADARPEPEQKPPLKEKGGSAFKRPSFITERSKLTATERGIALHLALQHIHFEKCGDVSGIEAQIDELAQNGVLTPEQAQAIEVERLTNFFRSDIGKRIQSAQTLRREFKFSLLYPAEHFYPGGGDDEILLQGVVDCFIEEEGALTVIDFKTDYVTDETLEEKALYYAPQLHAYSDALRRITNKPVKERVIYFFHLDYAYNV